MKITVRLVSVAVAAALALPALAAAPAAQKIEYPVAHRDHTVDTYFGVKVPAPYQWMENLTSPQLHQWVEAPLCQCTPRQLPLC